MAQDVSAFIGSFTLDMPGKASVSTSARNVGNNTREVTTTTRVGASASGMGTLVVSADGTWRLTTALPGPQTAGRWEANTSGPFSDKGGIELLNVRPDLGPNDRSWFVYRNSDGVLEVREPPYTAYNSYLLRGGGAARPAPATRPAPASAARPAAIASPAPKAVTPAPGPNAAAALPVGRRFTVDEFRKYVIGRTAAQLQAEFGAPTEKGYKKLTFSRLNIVDPADGSAFRTADVSFDEDGGTAWHVFLRE